MRIERSLLDLKGLLDLGKVTPKSFEDLAKLIALMLLACAAGLLVGETIRDEVYRGKKAEAYSGLFILLRHQLRLKALIRLIRLALDRSRFIVKGRVLSPI